MTTTVLTAATEQLQWSSRGSEHCLWTLSGGIRVGQAVSFSFITLINPASWEFELATLRSQDHCFRLLLYMHSAFSQWIPFMIQILRKKCQKKCIQTLKQKKKIVFILHSQSLQTRCDYFMFYCACAHVECVDACSSSYKRNLDNCLIMWLQSRVSENFAFEL